jgi:hypothetical protein
LEPLFEEPDRARVLFEREDLFVVFDLERELELDDLDFDDVPRFEPRPPDPLLERLPLVPDPRFATRPPC